MDIKYRDCTSYHESWRIKIQQSDMEYIYQAIIAVLCFSTPPSSNKAYNPHEIGWAFCSGYLQGGRESLLNMQISWLVDYKSTVFLCGWMSGGVSLGSARQFDPGDLLFYVFRGWAWDPNSIKKDSGNARKEIPDSLSRTRKNYHQTVRSICWPINFIDCIGLDRWRFCLFGRLWPMRKRVLVWANPKGHSQQYSLEG